MEKKHGIKAFFGEFKTFITRGNVLDMAVGVIVGGAFTAIINALSNNILKPLINWLLAAIMGKNSLSEIYTVLQGAYDETTGALVLENSIYIDWGAFINAIINFILIAFVLFCIVKFFNNLAEAQAKAANGINSTERKAVKKYMKEGLNKQQAKEKYAAEVRAAEEAKKLAEAKAAEEAAVLKAAEEAKATANTKLLEEIRDLLKNRQ